MARMSRSLILSEINHIMLRGIGHMYLFGNESDFRQFLNTLIRFKKDTNITIYVYCLMDNHVHILMKAPPEEVPLFFKRIEVSYASYYNKAYEHTGYLFQNRYKSESINSNTHFINALRYILKNPENAGICKWDAYSWSSAKFYLTGLTDNITDTSAGFNMIGGRENFLRLMNTQPDDADFSLAEPKKSRKYISDQSASSIIKQICNIENPVMLRSVAKPERNKYLFQLKQTGLAIRQIERMTGINRNVIQRAKESK